MKPEIILEHLLELADRMGVRIVKGKGDFNGGGCLVKEEKVIVVNKIKPMEYQLKVIANGLAKYGISEFYIIPVLRSFIEEDLRISTD